MKKGLRSFGSTLKRASRRFDGTVVNVVSGISDITKGTLAQAPPERCGCGELLVPFEVEIPDFQDSRAEPSQSPQQPDSPEPSISADLSFIGSNSANWNSNWWRDQDYYLCITVKEARNLALTDFDLRSTNTRVKAIMWQCPTEEMRAAKVEATTRVCSRNRHPMWHERFLFPIQSATSEAKIQLEVISRVLGRDSCSGQIQMSLGYLMDLVQRPMEPYSRWYRLSRKRPSDRVSGDLHFSFTVVPRKVCETALPSLSGRMNPAVLHSRYSPYSLKMSLHGLLDLRAMMTADTLAAAAQNIFLDIKVGQVSLTIKLDPKEVVASNPDDVAGSSISIMLDQWVFFPLDECFNKASPKTKNRNRLKKPDVCDVKLYLLLGKEVVCKTQVPIWDVPLALMEDATTEKEDTGADTLQPGTFSLSETSLEKSSLSGTLAALPSEALNIPFDPRHQERSSMPALSDPGSGSVLDPAGVESGELRYPISVDGGQEASFGGSRQFSAAMLRQAAASWLGPPSSDDLEADAVATPPGSRQVSRKSDPGPSTPPTALTASPEAMPDFGFPSPSQQDREGTLADAFTEFSVFASALASVEEQEDERPNTARSAPSTEEKMGRMKSMWQRKCPICVAVASSMNRTTAAALERRLTHQHSDGGLKPLAVSALPRAVPPDLDLAHMTDFDALLPKQNAPVRGPGRRYKRMMDVGYCEDLSGFPQLEFSLQLVPTSDAPRQVLPTLASPSAASVSSTLQDSAVKGSEMDVSPLMPIPFPEPLDLPCIDIDLDGTPQEAFDVLNAPESSFRQKMLEKENLRDIKHEAWSPAADVGPSARVRTVTYVRPLNIPVPMAPKSTKVLEVQTVTVDEPGGFVQEIKVTNDATKGDCYFVLIQFACTWDAVMKKARLRITFKFEVLKSLGMLRGVVEGGAKSSTKQGMVNWARELAAHMASVTASKTSISSVSSETLDSSTGDQEHRIMNPTSSQAIAASAMSSLHPKPTGLASLSLFERAVLILLALLVLAVFLHALAMWQLASTLGQLSQAVSDGLEGALEDGLSQVIDSLVPNSSTGVVGAF